MQTDVRQIQGFFNIMYHVFKFFIHPSICPSIHLSMYSSIYPSIHHIWQCADRCKTHPRVFQYYVTCFYVFFIHPSTHLSMNFTWTASLICLKPESPHPRPSIHQPTFHPSIWLFIRPSVWNLRVAAPFDSLNNKRTCSPTPAASIVNGCFAALTLNRSCAIIRACVNGWPLHKCYDLCVSAGMFTESSACLGKVYRYIYICFPSMSFVYLKVPPWFVLSAVQL